MEKLPERKKRVLCTNIESAIYEARQIAQNQSLESESHALALKIILHLKEIKEQALAMEKRLYLYKETIEGLGFKRVRKQYKRRG